MDYKPFLSVNRFLGIGDSVRPSKKRSVQFPKSLLNFAPNLSGGERIRSGYDNYTDVTLATGTEILQCVPIQNPSEEDVHIQFASDSGQKVYQNPYWNGSGTKLSSNIKIDESLSLTVASITANGFTATTAANPTMSTTTDYYRNFVIKNSTQTEYALITASSNSGGTVTFTTNERLDGSGLNWASGNTFVLYRNFHDNLGFAPTYNTSLTDPPCVISDNSRIYFSGGQASATGNKGLISQYLSKTFFPDVSSHSFAWAGTYVSEERLRAPSIIGAALFDSVPSGSTALAANKTYWLAYALEYDGYQIGELSQLSTPASYTGGGYGTQNYLTSSSGTLSPIILVNLATLNKRATGLRVYMASDDGDTRSTGRQTDYYFIYSLSFVGNDDFVWAFTDSTGFYTLTNKITGGYWDGRGGTYLEDTDMVDAEPDTSYAYSMRTVIGNRHLLSNVYITSSATVDRENIFTNPLGGSEINAGIPQVSLFPNEEGFFKLRCEPTIGSRLSAILPIGNDELFVAKDRGILQLRTYVNSSGDWDFIPHIVDGLAGCATINGAKASNNGVIYFAGYDDIYAYEGGRVARLIEREDYQDWLYHYREVITKANKESCVVWVLKDGSIHFDIGQTYGNNWAFYPLGGWRNETFNETGTASQRHFFKWMTTLQSGTVLGNAYNTAGTFQDVMQFSNPTTGALYYNDNGTAIRAKYESGDIVIVGDENFDFVLDKVTFGKTLDVATTGTLDAKLYSDTVLLDTFSGLDKASGYLQIHSMTHRPRIGTRWGVDLNTNSSPEVMQSSGTIYQLDSVNWYGDVIPREKRVNEQTSAITSVGGDVTSNTVGGLHYIILNEAYATYTWDRPMNNTRYAIIPDSRGARVAGDDINPQEEFTEDLDSRTTTTFRMKASSDNTYFYFSTKEEA